jgi:hypothetical protein
MVALNIVRIFAVLFLMLAAEGRLSGPFPYSAAWGDIITGVVAVPVLWLLKDGAARHTPAIGAWNLFGTADLVWQSPSASRRQRARPCSFSPARARTRCSTRPGRSFRRCWSRSGSSCTRSSRCSYGTPNGGRRQVRGPDFRGCPVIHGKRGPGRTNQSELTYHDQEMTRLPQKSKRRG